jgi:hypothetical protein
LGWVTLAVALSTCAIVGFAISKSPKTVTSKELQDRRVQFDPAIGRKFDLTNLKNPKLLVAIGDCSGCSVQNTDFNQLKSVDAGELIGIYKPGADTQPISQEFDWFRLASDEGDLHTRLNAFFSPRAYVFGSDGSLRALQMPDEPLEAFLKRAGKDL